MPNNTAAPKYANTANKGGLPTPKYPAANSQKANASPKTPAAKKAKSKSMTKNELKKALADKCGVTTSQAGEFLDALAQIAVEQLGDSSVTDFSVPGLVKLRKKHKPATKAGTKPNPFKPGEMMEVKAKPASTAIKAIPLKAVKGVAS